MPMPVEWPILSICSTIALAFGCGGLWLRGQFSEVKDCFREELRAHELEDASRFNSHGDRILSLELAKVYRTPAHEFPSVDRSG